MGLTLSFHSDMQDKTGINQVLEERFNWHDFASPVLQDRKIFDNTCEKYDNWVAEQREKAATSTTPSNPRLSVSGTHRPTSSSSATAPVAFPATPDTTTNFQDHDAQPTRNNKPPA